MKEAYKIRRIWYYIRIALCKNILMIFLINNEYAKYQLNAKS